MSARGDLADALSGVLASAGPKVADLAQKAVDDAKAIGGAAGAMAAATGTTLAEILRDAAAGRISPDAAREAADRCLDGLSAIKDGTLEAGQVAAAARAREGLAIAKDVGLSLLKAAAIAAAGAL
jgi:hypothetical protein